MRISLKQGKVYLELAIYLEAEIHPPERDVGEVVHQIGEVHITGVFAVDENQPFKADIFRGLTGPAIDQLKKNLLDALDEDTIMDAFA